MANDKLYMTKVREQAKTLCETYDRDSFDAMLKRRGLERITPYIDTYQKNQWLTPIDINGKKRFHRGHMLILLRLSSCNDMHYTAGIQDSFDFEDVMSRRVQMCEYEAINVRDDAQRIEQLFTWLWGDDSKAFDPTNAVHTKAIIDLSLDRLDPDGFYENLNIAEGNGTFKLIHDLINMQTEIGTLVGMASDTGATIPNVQYIFDRQRRSDEIEELMLPMKSPFLAVPTRDMMVDERLDFIRQRNTLLIEKKYEELIELYDTHLYLYESDVEKHSELCVCMGHIFGDLIKDSERAAAAFQEALEYDSGNTEAFSEVSHHLREAEKWPELVELLSNHWDSIDDPQKRCSLILECAQVQAFKCQNIDEALGLYERCILEGHSGNTFDDLYKIIVGLMDNCTQLQKLRALVSLSLHVVNFAQCDKVESLLHTFDDVSEPLGMCLKRLVSSGIQSFKGDQPLALEVLREAIGFAPNNNLIDGMLLRIASKMKSNNEFREAMNDLEADSLSTTDLSNIWLRIAKVLTRLPNRDSMALEYAEKSVATNPAGNEAIDLCYNLATKTSQPDRAFIYASLKAARAKNPRLKTEMENVCRELKLSFADDDQKIISVYEDLLQFDELKAEVSDSICELMDSVDNEKAIAILQRVEPKCIVSGLSALVGELYQNVLERDITNDLKKGLLERYLGFMQGQGSAIDLDTFIPAHAQLYALTPSDRLLNMLKTTAHDDESAIKMWTDCLEDAVSGMDDNKRIAKIEMTLADCYQNILKDSEKAADAFANLLKAAPDNVPAFKCCFNAFERLERFFECTEITREFPMEKLSQQERFNYAMRCLTFALIHLYDTKTMKYYLDIIEKDDDKVIPAVLDQLIEKASAANLDTDQLICFLEQLESESTALTAMAMRIARAKLLLDSSRTSEVIDILGEEQRPSILQNGFEERVISMLRNAPDKDSEDYQMLASLWLPDVEDQNDEEEQSEEQHENDSIDTLVRECADNIDDDSFTAVINNALNTLSAEDKSRLCIKLGELYESKERLAQAEDYYKQAFKYTFALDLLDFYKRIGQVKKAVKLEIKIITKTKLPKATDENRNQIKLELAMLYKQLGDLNNSVKVFSDILENRQGLDKQTILAIYRMKATDLALSGQQDEAIATLTQASAEADIRQKEEFDVERCLLMRETAPDDAKKIYNSLKLRNAKSEKMVLLSVYYDLDADKLSEAAAKLDTLNNSSNNALKLMALELTIQLKQKRGDSADSLRETAQMLLEIAPEHPAAKAILEG